MVSILIIGGGIGGLSVARELAVRGIKSTVLERAPQLNPVGAGIIMNPNAMGVLVRNGLADEVRERDGDTGPCRLLLEIPERLVGVDLDRRVDIGLAGRAPQRVGQAAPRIA